MNSPVTPNQAIAWLFTETLKDVRRFKNLQKGIDSMDKVDADAEDVTQKYPFLKRKKSDAEHQASRKAIIEDNKKELKTIEIRGSNSDGLQPIIILLGDEHLIKDKVIEPFKLEVLTNKGWNIEFKEIDSSELTIDFVENLSKPSEKDGGIIIVNNCSHFMCKNDISVQNQIVRELMVRQKGVTKTGWSVVFTENTKDNGMSFSNDSFITYWKSDVYSLFVAE